MVEVQIKVLVAVAVQEVLVEHNLRLLEMHQELAVLVHLHGQEIVH